MKLKRKRVENCEGDIFVLEQRRLTDRLNIDICDDTSLSNEGWYHKKSRGRECELASRGMGRGVIAPIALRAISRRDVTRSHHNGIARAPLVDTTEINVSRGNGCLFFTAHYRCGVIDGRP